MYRTILFAAVAATFAFATPTFADQKSPAQAKHDKDCASLKASYDYVSSYARSNPKGNRRMFLSAYNMKLIGQDMKCAWATQA